MPERKIELIGPGYKIHSVTGNNPKIIEAEYVGPVACPGCNGTELRTKDRIERRLHHASMGRAGTCLHLLIGNHFSGGWGTRPERSFWRAVSWGKV